MQLGQSIRKGLAPHPAANVPLAAPAAMVALAVVRLRLVVVVRPAMPGLLVEALDQAAILVAHTVEAIVSVAPAAKAVLVIEVAHQQREVLHLVVHQEVAAPQVAEVALLEQLLAVAVLILVVSLAMMVEQAAAREAVTHPALIAVPMEVAHHQAARPLMVL